MHYLTHLYLSRNFHSKIVAGNFVGVAAKRVTHYNYNKRNYYNIHTDHIQGVVLHDLIDHFLDHHPVVQECRNRLQINVKFKADCIDLFFDHFLAKYWSQYSDIPLDFFIKNTNKTLKKHSEHFPYKSRKIFNTMAKNNLLKEYASLEGLHKIIKVLGKISGNVLIAESTLSCLVNDYKNFQTDFDRILPSLIEYVESNKDIINNPVEFSDSWISIEPSLKTTEANPEIINMKISYQDVPELVYHH